MPIKESKFGGKAEYITGSRVISVPVYQPYLYKLTRIGAFENLTQFRKLHYLYYFIGVLAQTTV